MAKKKLKTPLDLELDYIEEYLRANAQIMRLGHYTIEVERELLEECEDSEESEYMRIYGIPNQRKALVGVGQAFLDATAKEKAQIVAHELSHIQLSRISAVVTSLYKNAVAPNYWPMTYAQVDNAEEVTADEFGHIIAPLLLPYKYKRK